MSGRFRRLAETDRPPVSITVDGKEIEALQGDSLMVAMLASGSALRDSEFGDGRRAGFCLMGACQDCWVWQEEGPRVRACSTPVTEDMRLRTTPPENWP